MPHAALLLALLLLAAPLSAQDARRRTVSVSGDAQVLVVPDEVVLRFGVETLDADLATAAAANEATVEAVTRVARRAGVPAERIQTDYLNLEPQYASTERQNRYVPVLYGYRVRRSIVVTLRDLDRFDALLRDAVAAGANQVHGVEFRTTDLRRHRDEARVRAIGAAREKAEALAVELGQTLGPPLSITEDGLGWGSGYGSGWGVGQTGMAQNVIVEGAGSPPGDGATSPGQISVRARISVVFALAD